MNQKLFEKQLIELTLYFEKHLQNTMTLTKREHSDILNGILFLLLKCAEDIDFADYTARYSYAKTTNRQGMQLVMENLVNEAAQSTSLSYTDVIWLLKLSIHCFSNPIKMDINGEEWLKLASDFRILEMERLSIH